MKLNQVTLPAHDLARSIAFYETLGFVLIVQNDHYARFENPSDHSTLSLELDRHARRPRRRMSISNATISTRGSRP